MIVATYGGRNAGHSIDNGTYQPPLIIAADAYYCFHDTIRLRFRLFFFFFFLLSAMLLAVAALSAAALLRYAAIRCYCRHFAYCLRAITPLIAACFFVTL